MRLLICLLAAITVSSHPAARAQTAGELFDNSILHDISIDLHPRDWLSLQQNFTENTYYPVIFRWRGMEHEGGGIRSRGFGSRSGVKPGLRVDFNRYEPDQEFLGLKSLVLDNAVQDSSMAKEAIAMQLFRRMGLEASREAHARLFINGEYVGLYLIVEDVDKRFLKRAFGDDDGYLYEYNWVEPYYFEFRGPDPGLYSPAMFEPKTHERDPRVASLVDMIRTANEAPDGELAAAMAPFLDLKALATHIAVENFIAEVDGFTGYAGMNNFYLYQFSGSNQFRFLPWDKDVAFQTISHPIDYNLHTNVLIRRLMGVPEFAAEYYSALRSAAEMAGGEGGWLELETERIYNLTRVAARSDPRKVCEAGQGAACNDAFEVAMEWLRQFARHRAGFVLESVSAAGR